MSKLAVLELCGWLEESMDDIVLRCSMRELKKSVNRKYVQEQIVDRTHGFDYNKHFRKMLIQLVGIVNVEKIERRVNVNVSSQFRATLGSLIRPRNSQAHTHVGGGTRIINAPSVSLKHFQDLYAGLVEYDRVVRSMRF